MRARLARRGPPRTSHRDLDLKGVQFAGFNGYLDDPFSLPPLGLPTVFPNLGNLAANPKGFTGPGDEAASRGMGRGE